jgi:HSP20 family protein
MGLPKAYDPLDDMRKLQKELDEMFDSFFERGSYGRGLSEWGLRAPLSDIEDRGDTVVVSAELPGMRKEDIRIAVDKDSITISAERRDAAEEKKKSYYYCERSYSGYRRSFALPAEVEPDSADAEYRDGLLRVAMRKAQKAQAKKEVRIR